MIKFRQFKVPGIYIKDIKEYTGYSDVLGACKKAGVTLLRLRTKQYAPLGIKDAYKVLRVIRSLQGQRLLREVDHDSKILTGVK